MLFFSRLFFWDAFTASVSTSRKKKIFYSLRTKNFCSKHILATLLPFWFVFVLRKIRTNEFVQLIKGSIEPNWCHISIKSVLTVLIRLKNWNNLQIKYLFGTLFNLDIISLFSFRISELILNWFQFEFLN